MPSVSAAAVQPPPQEQARAETILAPGAAPSIAPPNMSLAGGDAGDVRAVRRLDDADVDEVGQCPGRPAGVRSTSSRNSTTNGICSATGGGRVVGAEVADVEASPCTAASRRRR